MARRLRSPSPSARHGMTRGITPGTMAKLSLRDLDVRGKRVLVRVDFNVPTEERDGAIVITDDTRMRESLPTINYLREQGAKTILMAHFGRPKGKPVEKYSLRPVGVALHNLINHPVAFSHDCIGADAEKIVADMKDGDVTLLENVRFHAGEEANDPDVRRSARQARRWPLRERRFRRRPSRACLDRGYHKIRQAIRHGIPDGEGAQISGRRTGQTGAGRSSSSSAARRFPTRSA